MVVMKMICEQSGYNSESVNSELNVRNLGKLLVRYIPNVQQRVGHVPIARLQTYRYLNGQKLGWVQGINIWVTQMMMIQMMLR